LDLALHGLQGRDHGAGDGHRQPALLELLLCALSGRGDVDVTSGRQEGGALGLDLPTDVVDVLHLLQRQGVLAHLFARLGSFAVQGATVAVTPRALTTTKKKPRVWLKMRGKVCGFMAYVLLSTLLFLELLDWLSIHYRENELKSTACRLHRFSWPLL
jgi:hypothetical protein